MRQESSLRKKIEDYSYGLADIISDNISSKIYKGIRDNTKEAVAIKVIDIKGFKNKQDKSALEIQIQVLRKVRHSNILKCFDVYSTTNNCYIITEYCQGGDMKNMFDSKKNKFSYSEALSIFKDIYKGYKYLFMSGYIHRNIDPSNILIKNGEYKISDFGMASKELDLPLKVDEYIPISPYKSPQALKTDTIGPKCDVWSLGVILYQLLFNKVPFEGYDNKFDYKISPDFGDIPKTAKQFIEKCLISSSLRITFSQLQSHPFISQVLSTPSISVPLRNDYNSIPLTRITSKLQNKPASQLDRIKDQRKNKGQIVSKALIGQMRYLFRVQQLLPQCKLQFLVIKQLLSILQCFKKSIDLEDAFQCDYLHDFFFTQKSRKVTEVIQMYQKKYSPLYQQFQKYIIKGTKDRQFLKVLDNNFSNNEAFVISTIPYILQMTKSYFKQLKAAPSYQKLQDNDMLPKQLQSLALKTDFLITYYQLNCLRITDWNDYLLFVDNSRIDEILQCPPSQMQKVHVKSIERKIIELEI